MAAGTTDARSTLAREPTRRAGMLRDRERARLGSVWESGTPRTVIVSRAPYRR